MASENIFSLAEQMGFWDPASGEEFKVYEITDEAVRPTTRAVSGES